MKIKNISRLLIFVSLNFLLFTNYYLPNVYARATVEELSQVEKLFMEGKYERVVVESTKLIDSGSYGREELLYLKGLSQIQLNSFKVARETLRYMIERYPRGKRAFDGYIGIGDAFFLEGKAPEAITGYNEALTNFPDHKNSSIVYYKLGSAYQKLGNSAKANEYFNKVKKSSPLSFESNMAPKDTTPINMGAAEAPAAPQEAPVIGSCEVADYFYVQAGYFKNKENAEKLVEGLNRKGYDSYLSAQTKGGAAFYRVKVGHFKVKAEAEVMAKKLKADGYKTKVCW